MSNTYCNGRAHRGSTANSNASSRSSPIRAGAARRDGIGAVPYLCDYGQLFAL
jgi:hypothetical protein